ncbi:MAG TPA: hypothetical protein PKE65_08770, partial [Rhizobiaceae bacterium]|nr:hypothetical protein [Rhizobiaceae bacterium]
LYYVDSSLDVVDEGILVPEYGFGGFDTVRTSANFFWDYYSVAEQIIVEEFADNPGGLGVTTVGGVFDNTLFGHSGTDIIFGRGGNDVYIAGDGIDWMSLSTLGVTDVGSYTANGINTVVVERRLTGDFSYDIVFDFESGWDYFDVRDYGYTSASQIFDRGFNDGYGNSWYALGDGLDYLYVVGLEKEDLLLSDFQVT